MPPLSELSVLLETSYDYMMDLPLIIQKHGPSLKYLVWDVRRGPREPSATTRTHCTPLRCLETIGVECKELEELGISIDFVPRPLMRTYPDKVKQPRLTQNMLRGS